MTKDYTNDFTAFFSDLYRVEGAYGPKPLIPPFLAEFLGLAFKDGKPAARNILDARVKKQGKSALAGGVALFMASRRPYSEVVIAASDKDQAKDRVLRAVKFACENGPLASHAKVFRDTIELDNRSIINALPMDWQGAAGGNYSAVIFDELHGYVYESQRRLFDELLPPPTQPEAVRWIASYAGFLGESELLKEWWDRGLAGEKISETLPIYLNQSAGLLAFIDTGPEAWRMDWMTQEYIDQVRESERENTYRRLWLNEWTNAESAFVPMEAWERCYSKDLIPLQDKDPRRVVLGLDASTTRDITALVGSYLNTKTGKKEVLYVKTFKPQRGFLRMGKPTIDLSLVQDEIERLHAKGQVDCVVYDPFQLHSIATDLEKKGIRIKEFPQTNQRTEADQALYDAIIGGQVQHYNHPDLNAHIRNAIAVESVRGFRLAKDKTSLKIDAAVALSMSLYGLKEYGSGIAHSMPDPFEFDFEHYGMHTVDSVYSAFIVDKQAPKVHKPGITWRNCKWRMKGCPACVDELEAEGYFKDQDQDITLQKDAIYTSVNTEPPIALMHADDYQEARTRGVFRSNYLKRLKDD